MQEFKDVQELEAANILEGGKLNRYRFDSENHIHLLDNKPLLGTSTITQIISKGHSLNWWASGKALELLGWTPAPKWKPSLKLTSSQISELKIKRLEPICEAWKSISNMNTEQILTLLDKCYKNWKTSLDDSAEKGIDLHAELERFIKDNMQGLMGEYDDKIQPFIDWTALNVKKFLWSEAHCYSEKLWCGGISDFGAELKDGRIILGDFKSSKEAYISHFFQGAGYAIQIEENGLLDAQGNKIGSCDHIDDLMIVPFGAKEVKPVFNKLSMDLYKEGFIAATKLHGIVNMEKEF